MALSRQNGSLQLFRFRGIDVQVHWSWFLIAMIELETRARLYHAPVWNVAEYLALFLIVLLHEFGHAFACRQTGGEANRIVLWPLGGLAYVNPPPRPGALLWSIAAGPLVNVALLPITFALYRFGQHAGWGFTQPDASRFVFMLMAMNMLLLVFNILPIYPLDGGQILRALLWFVIGRVRSLTAAAVIGLLGASGLIAYAVWQQSYWFGVMGVFVLMRCWSGLQLANALGRILNSPRREGFLCPSCNQAPPVGAHWLCGRCNTKFDTFETQAVCPKCGISYPQTACLDCNRSASLEEWKAAAERVAIHPG
jgi:Zn-dependent protease